MNAPDAADPARFVDHVGIVVADADEAASRFAARFGLEVVHDEVVDEVGARLVYLAGADRGVPTTIQLVEPVRQGPIQTHFDQRGEGVHHVCLAVTDLDATLAALDGEDDARVFSGGRQRRCCMLAGQTCGTLIELAELNSPGQGGEPR
jgi:methylmalonyl-CoA/ethylmalonyl-CoA epimerase